MKIKANFILPVLLFISLGLLAYTLYGFFGLKSSGSAIHWQNLALSADNKIVSDQRAAAAKIGTVGSQHIHADIKIYVSGKQMNFADNKYYMRSSFVHFDNQQDKADAGGVLHMHATGAPMWAVLKSLGMEIGNNCLTLENNEKLCNNNKQMLKFFVNGKNVGDIENYVFKDLDKILVSYGDETGQQLIEQIKSVTDYAKNH